jgi:hypothetical protein
MAGRLRLMREEAAELRAELDRLAVRRGKETGFQVPDLKGDYERQMRTQDERLKKYFDDMASAPKAVKIAAEIEKENKAFQDAVAGLLETDERYLQALETHRRRVAEIQRRGQEKTPKDKDPVGEFLKKLQEENDKAAESMHRVFTDIARDAATSGQELSESWKKYLAMLDSPAFQKLDEEQQEHIRLAFQEADAVEKTASAQERLNRLLAGTPGEKTAQRAKDQEFLSQMLDAGKLSMEQYDEILKKLDDKTKNQKSLAEELGLSFTSAFEDAIAGGKKFSDVLQGLYQDILKILVRKNVTEPLLASFSGSGASSGGGLLSGIGGLFSGLFSGLFGSADGNVIRSPALSAYSGSIVDRPTLFPFAHGVGLMGEAGAEAILPLRRGQNGKLGVASQMPNVNIVIHNTVAGEAEVSVRPRNNDAGDLDIEVIVARVLSQDLARNGPITQGLGRTFGLSRSV